MKYNTPEVWLISLPWTNLTEPNLGLSILKSALQANGINCRVWNLNLAMLQFIKSTTYQAIADTYALNDFLFSHALDPIVTPHQLRWLREKTYQIINTGHIDPLEYGGVDGVIDQLLELRNEIIPHWLNQCAITISQSNATLIGFTCMFDQTIASLALAKKIKHYCPEKTLALGGYAVRQPTAQALMKSFHWIDAICLGEGEKVITPLAKASANGGGFKEIPNLIYRSNNQQLKETTQIPKINMDDCPVPDFTDHFKDIEQLWQEHKIKIKTPRLPIDTSRGCWWGAKKHCVFCGINNEDLTYRSRSAENLLQTLKQLSSTYNISNFRFSDYILPYQYFNTFLPELARKNKPYNLSTEIKANISREKFKLLAMAGFTEVQPGIESFSTPILARMNKHVSAAQNVHTILMGQQHNVHVLYNLLYGLPDDSPREIEEMIQQLPRLFHLPPPATCVKIQITRFSPLQNNPERFNIPSAIHDPSYHIIFSKEYLKTIDFDLNNYAYHFERPFEYPTQLSKLYREIDKTVSVWKKKWSQNPPNLFYEKHDEQLLIHDTRNKDNGKTYWLNQEESSTLNALNQPISYKNLYKKLKPQLGKESIDKIIKKLDLLEVIFTDNDKLLNLTLPKDS